MGSSTGGRSRADWIVLVDDDFIKSLFGIIEDLSYDVNDPYHYPVIRVLVSILTLLSPAVGIDCTAGDERAVYDFGA